MRVVDRDRAPRGRAGRPRPPTPRRAARPTSARSPTRPAATSAPARPRRRRPAGRPVDSAPVGVDQHQRGGRPRSARPRPAARRPATRWRPAARSRRGQLGDVADHRGTPGRSTARPRPRSAAAGPATPGRRRRGTAVEQLAAAGAHVHQVQRVGPAEASSTRRSSSQHRAGEQRRGVHRGAEVGGRRLAAGVEARRRRTAPPPTPPRHPIAMSHPGRDASGDAGREGLRQGAATQRVPRAYPAIDRYPSRGLDRDEQALAPRARPLAVGVRRRRPRGRRARCRARSRRPSRGRRRPAVSAASRDRAERLLPGVPLLPRRRGRPARADLVLLTVPDDVLPRAGRRPGRRPAPCAPGQLVVHTSGAHGLARARAGRAARAPAAGAAPGDDVHRHRVDLDRLAGARFGVTAPEALRPVAEALVVEMGGEPVWIAEEAPRALPRGARARRQPPGHPGRRGDGPAARGRRRATRRGCSAPLLGAALDNALRSGDAALTGPVVARRRRHRRGALCDASPVRAGGGARVSRAGPADRRPGAGRRAAKPEPRGAPAGRARRAAPSAALVHESGRARRPWSSTRRRPSWRGAARADRLRRLALVPTMGALHAGHRALIRAARAQRATSRGEHLRQPAAVRPERGPRPLPADLGRRPRDVRGRGRRRWSSRPRSTRCTRAAEPAVPASTAGRWARCSRAPPARALRRRAHRRAASCST